MAKGLMATNVRSLVASLRVDFGRKTLGELVREREAAATELERLLLELESEGERLGRVSIAAPVESSPRSTAGRWWQDRALLRLKDVSQVVGLSRSGIYGRMAEGRFPRPVQVSERSVRWRSADIAGWLSALTRE
jgi:prophage regulatory protein